MVLICSSRKLLNIIKTYHQIKKVLHLAKARERRSLTMSTSRRPSAPSKTKKMQLTPVQNQARSITLPYWSLAKIATGKQYSTLSCSLHQFTALSVRLTTLHLVHLTSFLLKDPRAKFSSSKYWTRLQKPLSILISSFVSCKSIRTKRPILLCQI